MLSSIVGSLAAHYPQLATNNFEKDLANFDLAGRDGHLEDPHDRCDDLPLPARPALRVPEGRAAVLRELPAHDVLEPYKDFVAEPEVAKRSTSAAPPRDHEQNCSTSTVRMVGSSAANPLHLDLRRRQRPLGRCHGGANTAVMPHAAVIHDEGDDGRLHRAAKSGTKGNA